MTIRIQVMTTMKTKTTKRKALNQNRAKRNRATGINCLIIIH